MAQNVRPIWDESGFALQLEDMRPDPPPQLLVSQGRVFRDPPTVRKVGPRLTTRVCIHGRPEYGVGKQPVVCPGCQFEAPLLERKGIAR